MHATTKPSKSEQHSQWVLNRNPIQARVALRIARILEFHDFAAKRAPRLPAFQRGRNDRRCGTVHCRGRSEGDAYGTGMDSSRRETHHVALGNACPGWESPLRGAKLPNSVVAQRLGQAG